MDVDPSLRQNPTWRDAFTNHKRRSAAAAVAILLVLIAVIPPLRSVAALAASKVILVVLTPFAPSVKGLNTAPEGSKVLAADGSVLGGFEEGERIPIRIGDLPPHVKGAVLASEDAEFYRHDGVDPSAIVRATLNMATGSRQQGGSTITQQLAKLNYTSGERTIFRKLREVLYATRLERDYSKDQLLERYLNQVYFGDGNYGIETAARRTFGVPAAQLTPDQAAAIAVRIRAPSSLDPRKKPEPVLERRNRTLAAMADAGDVPKEDVAALQAKPLTPIALPPSTPKTERLVIDRARREILGKKVLSGDEEDQLAKLEGGGLVVETTLDPKAQKAARESAEAALPRPEDPSAAIVSVQPGDGAIRVLVGDHKGGEVDVGTRPEFARQPGSSYKPFTYAAALEAKIHPGTTYESRSPYVYDYQGQKVTVTNAEEGTGGLMTLDDATVESVNVVYTQVALKVGPDKIKKVAERLGQPKSIKAFPTIALGASEVNPLDMAASYGVFASAGTYAEPYLVARIKDGQGKVVYQFEKKIQKGRMDPKEAGVINGVLQRVVKEGTGKAAAIDRTVAGKTGTTNDSKDVWFVGYTPQLATAVWVGNVGTPTPLKDARGRPLFGGGPPARIFSGTMKGALQGVKETPMQVNTPEDLGLKLPGAVPPPPPTQPQVNGAATTLPPPLNPADSVPQQLTIPTLPLPGQPTTTQTTQPPRTTTTRAPCPTTTSGPPTTLPAGVTSTTARRPPGC